MQKQKQIILIPESVLIHILTFMNSFEFYRISKLLNLSLSLINNTLTSLPHYYYNNKIDYNYNKDSKEYEISIKNYLLIDYFTEKRHLLFLNEWPEFKSYFFNNSWATNIYIKHHKFKHYIINIMRLSFFVDVLRNIYYEEIKKEKDKIVRTNIDICFTNLIIDIQKESEYEAKLLKTYINCERCI